MLARPHRFHGPTALKFVYGRGQTVRGPHLALKYVQNPRRESYRAAVVVSRKVDKSAVVRNRLRRRVYAVVERVSADIKAPYDLVFTAFSNHLATCDTAEVEQTVKGQLHKAGVLSAASPDPRGIVRRKGLKD